jgi:4-hydroxybenzoate polyprenyltransferase
VSRFAATTRALLLACHPIPTAAVTTFATALAVAVGNPAATCATVAVAVLAGQLSIGWSNDRIDVALDRSAHRTDKPIARADVGARTVDVAIAAAVAVAVGGSFALGWRAALFHLAGVACGWAYNLGVKRTVLSWLPYAIAFGTLPGVATLALPHPELPAGWAVAAGALLGMGAHLTNAAPDLAADRAFGVRGLPHLIGARRAVLLAAGLLLAASIVLVFGPAPSPSALRLAGFGLAVVLTGCGVALLWRRPAARAGFYGTVAVAGVDIALLLLGPKILG